MYVICIPWLRGIYGEYIDPCTEILARGEHIYIHIYNY